jgi:hypothetical protein
MPAAGDLILAADFPAKVTARVGATFTDFDPTGYEATSTPCEITFVVGTSGDGVLHFFVRWNPDTNGERLNADVEIREDDSSGTPIHSPDETTGGVSMRQGDAATAGDNFYGERDLNEFGLTPGGTYWAQLQIDLSGTTSDIFDQRLTFRPA